MINTRTRLYAVLGHPVLHSLSPPMQNAAFAELRMNAAYLALDVMPGRLGFILDALSELGFAGVNLTVPLKEAAFELLDDLDENARLMRSVNTIRFEEAGRRRGYSTDGAGFLTALREEFGISVKGRRIFILGCGGAGRAIAIACACAGAGELALGNRDFSRTERLAAELSALPGKPDIRTIPSRQAAWLAACRVSEIVVQATSVGLRPEDTPLLESGAFHTGQWFYDLIYHTPQTVMMRAASNGGARVANGLGMLLHQGAQALEIWTGKPAPTAIMRAALMNAVYGKATMEQT